MCLTQQVARWLKKGSRVPTVKVTSADVSMKQARFSNIDDDVLRNHIESLNAARPVELAISFVGGIVQASSLTHLRKSRHRNWRYGPLSLRRRGLYRLFFVPFQVRQTTGGHPERSWLHPLQSRRYEWAEKVPKPKRRKAEQLDKTASQPVQRASTNIAQSVSAVTLPAKVGYCYLNSITDVVARLSLHKRRYLLRLENEPAQENEEVPQCKFALYPWYR